MKKRYVVPFILMTLSSSAFAANSDPATCAYFKRDVQTAIDNVTKGSNTRPTGGTFSSVPSTQSMLDALRDSKEKDRYLDYLKNLRDIHDIDCELPDELTGPDYYGAAVDTSKPTLFVVHQTWTFSNASFSNVGGVNRVIDQFVSQYGQNNFNYYIDNQRPDDDRFFAKRTDATAITRGRTLNFQGDDITVVGGNFDASISIAVVDLLDNYNSNSQTISLKFPMDAIYTNALGYSLQQMYNANSSKYKTWLKEAVQEEYADNLADVEIELYLDKEHSQSSTPLQTYNVGALKKAKFRVVITSPNDCLGNWTLKETYPGTSFSNNAIGSILSSRSSGSCFVSWGQHSAVSGDRTVCRHTRGAPGDERLVKWSPIGFGSCPDKATVYNHAGQIDAIFNVER